MEILALWIVVVTKFAAGQKLIMRTDNEHIVRLNGREVEEAMVGRHPDCKLVSQQAIFAGLYCSV